MFSSVSVVLDVAIGIIFVFLLVSLICSQINEKISQWLRMRAKGLEDGLRQFIVGDPNLQQLLYSNPLIKSLTPEDAWVTQFLEKTPGLKQLIRADKNPVSIPPRTFALALFDMMIPNAAGNTSVAQLHATIATLPTTSPMRAPLLSIISTAENNINTVRQNIEAWYDSAMTKTTALYQGHMWRFALVIASLVAIVLNVDTVAVGVNLWSDSSLRSALVAEAGKYAQGTPQKEAALKQLNSLSLPIGWQVQFSPTATDWLSKIQSISIKPNDWLAKPNQPETTLGWRSGLFKLAGWLITALAGAQGAPFWFDLLKKLTRRG
jgi:hypothetical protein